MARKVVNVRKSGGSYIYIGRGSPWGNPYSHLAKSAAQYRVATRAEAIERFREYALERLQREPEWLEPLRSQPERDLACWCKPQACHGDVLLELMQGCPHGLPRDEHCDTCCTDIGDAERSMRFDWFDWMDAAGRSDWDAGLDDAVFVE